MSALPVQAHRRRRSARSSRRLRRRRRVLRAPLRRGGQRDGGRAQGRAAAVRAADRPGRDGDRDRRGAYGYAATSDLSPRRTAGRRSTRRATGPTATRRRRCCSTRCPTTPRRAGTTRRRSSGHMPPRRELFALVAAGRRGRADRPAHRRQPRVDRDLRRVASLPDECGRRRHAGPSLRAAERAGHRERRQRHADAQPRRPVQRLLPAGRRGSARTVRLRRLPARRRARGARHCSRRRTARAAAWTCC